MINLDRVGKAQNPITMTMFSKMFKLLKPTTILRCPMLIRFRAHGGMFNILNKWMV